MASSKRRQVAPNTMAPTTNRSLADFLRGLFNVSSTRYVYDMQVPADRLRLIDDLWHPESYTAACSSLSDANSDFVTLFEQQTADDRPLSRWKRRPSLVPRFEGVLSSIFRSRSKFQVPFSTAAVSVRLHHHQTPEAVVDTIRWCNPGACLSKRWTQLLVTEAMEHDPGARYETAGGLTACAIDNFRIHSNYGAFSSGGVGGEAIDMTTWMSLALPATTMPPNFSFDALLGNGGIFRTDLRRADFTGMFSVHNPAILAAKNERFGRWLQAAKDGTFNDCPSETWQSPYPPTRQFHHKPIYDRTQSSYADVDFEMDVVRDHPYHRNSDMIVIGGDGLTFGRMIHRLAQNPRRFLEMKPVVLPMLGDHPHKSHHLMNAGWRLWWPFIERMARVVNNRNIVADPQVKVFNPHAYFLVYVLGRACSEFVAEISATGSDFRATTQFLHLAEGNISFAIVVHFCYDFLFLYRDFRMHTRMNESKKMDLDCCESVAMYRASGKTNYTQWTTNRVYWGTALREPLQSFYHNIRTLRYIDTHVGYDMFPEMVNKSIRQGVESHITRDHITRFVEELNFTSTVARGLDAVGAHHPRAKALKNNQVDVDLLKTYLYKCIGSNFAVATRRSEQNLLDLDLKDWGGRAGRMRQHMPWTKVAAANADIRAYVDGELSKLCHWHSWAP